MTTAQLLDDPAWQKEGDEVLGHLRALLQLDTRNPPGNENIAADYIRNVLAKDGIDSQTIGPSPDRASIIARLRGDGSKQPLLLMCHTDVVAVEEAKWSHPPFAGEIGEDGFLYGRGALDMKNMVAMELMTMLLLKRRKVKLKRDVIFMAAADEEVGGSKGAGWVVENHPDLIRAEFALNEGGGNARLINGKLYYLVQTAEKAGMRFKLIARGRPGHGATPHNDNCVIKLARAIARLHEAKLPPHVCQTMRAQVQAIADHQPPDARNLWLDLLDPAKTDAAIASLPGIDNGFRDNLRAMFHNSISPTLLKAGEQINVIPSACECSLDARVLPGTTSESFLAGLKAIFGEEVEIQFLRDVSKVRALEIEPSGELYETIKQVLTRHVPDAAVAPKMLAGATDGRHVTRLGIKVFGFAPELYVGPGENSRIHGHDERIHVKSIKWGSRVLYDVVEKFAS